MNGESEPCTFGPRAGHSRNVPPHSKRRIARRETPGELPVELPSKYELVLNLKTAAALGLKFPQSVCCVPTE